MIIDVRITSRFISCWGDCHPSTYTACAGRWWWGPNVSGIATRTGGIAFGIWWRILEKVSQFSRSHIAWLPTQVSMSLPMFTTPLLILIPMIWRRSRLEWGTRGLTDKVKDSWPYMCIYFHLCWNKNEHRNSRASCLPKGADDAGERGPIVFILIVEKEWLRGVAGPIFFYLQFFTFSESLPTYQPYKSMTGPIGQRVLTG
jgi:hypothetical protein